MLGMSYVDCNSAGRLLHASRPEMYSTPHGTQVRHRIPRNKIDIQQTLPVMESVWRTLTHRAQCLFSTCKLDVCISIQSCALVSWRSNCWAARDHVHDRTSTTRPIQLQKICESCPRNTCRQPTDPEHMRWVVRTSKPGHHPCELLEDSTRSRWIKWFPKL
jgi:hypothetical protein